MAVILVAGIGTRQMQTSEPRPRPVLSGGDRDDLGVTQTGANVGYCSVDRVCFVMRVSRWGRVLSVGAGRNCVHGWFASLFCVCCVSALKGRGAMSLRVPRTGTCW